MVVRQEPAQGKKGVIFSGMRPTGLLHLGDYMGALQNWVKLQEEYGCIYCAVDIHALTTIETADDIAEIQPNIEDMVLDWLAAGIDPERSIVFVQSHVPEVMALHTLLSMVTPLGWLMRVPTFKDKVRQMSETEDTVNYGLVGYPILQTADMIDDCKGGNIVEQGVDRKVTAPGIFFRGPKGIVPVPVQLIVKVLRAVIRTSPEGARLNDVITVLDMHEAKTSANQKGIAEQFSQLPRPGIRDNIEILRLAAQQQVAHTPTYEIGRVAVANQAIQDA